jgi:transcriptional regulator with XRE-family HTH domain
MTPPRLVEISLGEAVRQLRERRHMSLRTLAERTGFSASFMSQVENSQASPSISSLEKIAAALGVTLGQFFNAAETHTPAVTRVDQRPTIKAEWSKADLEALGGDATARLEPVVVTLHPGGSSGKHARSVANEQFALVLEGEVGLVLGEEPEQMLSTGDAVTIRPALPRAWRNASEAITRILVVTLRASL